MEAWVLYYFTLYPPSISRSEYQKILVIIPYRLLWEAPKYGSIAWHPSSCTRVDTVWCYANFKYTVSQNIPKSSSEKLGCNFFQYSQEEKPWRFLIYNQNDSKAQLPEKTTGTGGHALSTYLLPLIKNNIHLPLGNVRRIRGAPALLALHILSALQDTTANVKSFIHLTSVGPKSPSRRKSVPFSVPVWPGSLSGGLGTAFAPAFEKLLPFWGLSFAASQENSTDRRRALQHSIASDDLSAFYISDEVSQLHLRQWITK